jgi:hypothetical protein
MQQRLLAGLLPSMQESAYDRLTLLSTALGLLGATAAAVLVIPHWGPGAGLVLAIIATCALGFLVPGFLAMHAPGDE